MRLMPTTMLTQNLMWTRWKRNLLFFFSFNIIVWTCFSGFDKINNRVFLLEMCECYDYLLKAVLSQKF